MKVNETGKREHGHPPLLSIQISFDQNNVHLMIKNRSEVAVERESERKGERGGDLVEMSESWR